MQSLKAERNYLNLTRESISEKLSNCQRLPISILLERRRIYAVHDVPFDLENMIQNLNFKIYLCVSGFLYTLISVCFPQLFDVLTPFQGKRMKILR